MRFVPTQTPEQQSGLVIHRTRHLFIRQQTSVINAIRAHCAEFGMVAPVGRRGVEELLNVVANEQQVPEIARACLLALGAQLRRIKEQILEFDRMIAAWHRSCETSRRLDEIPGVGPALATALVASRVIAIYAAYSRPVRSPSSATPRSTALDDRGSPHCWHGGQPRSQLSHSPISSPEWLGP
jgi:transposase